MKKLLVLCGAALFALLATMSWAPSAQAYPDVTIDLTVDRQVLYGGEEFVATGTSNVTCAWTVEWNGVVRTGSGSSGSPYDTTYTAPAVTKITKIPLNGTCVYTDPTVESSDRTAAGAAVWKRTIIITVLPRGNATAPPTNNGADLPNAGGPNMVFLLGGLGLLLAGASAVTVARRRAEGVDMYPGQA